MGDRGIGSRQEKAEEVRQNDRGKMMQSQTMLFQSFCRGPSLVLIPLSLFVCPGRIFLPEKPDFEGVWYR
jgi:hypothetical protein